MRRTAAVAVLVLGLAACGSSKSDVSANTTTTQSGQDCLPTLNAAVAATMALPEWQIDVVGAAGDGHRQRTTYQGPTRYEVIDLDSSGINGAFTGWELGNNHHPQINVVRVGLNYLFNFAAPAPVIAQY